MPTDYEFDVFLSYKRTDQTLGWTREVTAKLKHWLTEEVGGREASIFVDETSVDIGADWPEEIKYALQHSRCMVGIWSPSYFQSSWCVSEWKTFLERQRITENHRLIAPLKFHDGEHFPEQARNTQWLDVSDYAITIPAFWNSANAIELEIKLKEFSKSLAMIVKSAPPYRTDWPIVEAPGNTIPKITLAKL